MMKRALLTLLLFSFSAFAQCPNDNTRHSDTPDDEYLTWDENWYGWNRDEAFHGTYLSSYHPYSLEARIGAFYPFSKRLRQNYADLFLSVDVEFATRLCDRWQVWTGVGYIAGNGRTNNLSGDRRRIYIVPISLGIKYLYPIWDCLDAYLGAAGTYNILSARDRSANPQTHRKNAFGATAKTGLTYQLGDSAYLDFFLDYLWAEFKFRNNSDQENVHLNGFRFGVGAGIEF
jgi:hypothetical protein